MFKGKKRETAKQPLWFCAFGTYLVTGFVAARWCDLCHLPACHSVHPPVVTIPQTRLRLPLPWFCFWHHVEEKVRPAGLGEGLTLAESEFSSQDVVEAHEDTGRYIVIFQLLYVYEQKCLVPSPTPLC